MAGPILVNGTFCTIEVCCALILKIKRRLREKSNLIVFMWLYLLFLKGHMRHPFNHFLEFQVVDMDVSLVGLLV